MTRRTPCFMTVIFMVALFSVTPILSGSEYDQGKALYDEKCMICHGANGKGDGPAAAALSPSPKDFNSPEFWQQKNIDQVIMQQVKHGKGPMPAFSLSDDEIKAIIDYMSHTFKK